MQQYPILATKLYSPHVRAEWVSRPRLTQRLNEVLEPDTLFSRKLTLISAPAGFGKTTLVSEWIQDIDTMNLPVAIAWLSLDASDNDVTRFLIYFVSALQTIDDSWGAGVLSVLQSPQSSPGESILITLVNEISTFQGRVILVLDDYHLIEAQAIQDTLTFLIRHLPPQMHLVIATRVDPPWPLARLRARDQLFELRAADLRFTSAEAAEFLNQVMGLTLPADDIAALEMRTEGWIAGLQLAALSMQGSRDTKNFIRSFTGSNRYVLDYLLEEVLEQQSEDIQTFLLRTSILNRLTGPLCDAVRFDSTETATGQKDGQSILEMLERANLFVVPLDNERRWYRYHHLFADLLQQRLRQTQQSLEPELHIQASVWYEQNGFIDFAIDHALSAGYYERAIHLIDDNADAMWASGKHGNLKGWLAGLPDAWLCVRPQLCIYHAWFLFSTGQEEIAQKLLQVAEQRLASGSGVAIDSLGLPQEPLSASSQMKLRGRLDAIRSVIDFWQKDMSGVIRHANQALEMLATDDPWRGMAVIALGDAYYFQGDMKTAYQTRLSVQESSKPVGDLFSYIIANLKVATSLRELGQLPQTIEICQKQAQFAKENGLSQTIFVGWAKALWAQSLAEKNELDQALELATQSMELNRGGDMAFSGYSYVVLAQVLFSRHDFTGAMKVLQELENIENTYYLPFYLAESMAAWKARIWLAQDQLELASRWIKESGFDVEGRPTSMLSYVDVALARVLLAQGDLEKADGFLTRLLEAAEAGGHTARVIEVLVVTALNLQTEGNTSAALSTLERAIMLAEPGGYVRIFIDEGPPMARILYEVLSHGITQDYVRRLLAAFPDVEPKAAAVSPVSDANAGLIEPLSEREIEVLRLIAEGLTNPEIATRLYLSLNTIKVHTRNIYGKLGVNNRTQAASRAKGLGIINNE